MARGTKGKRWSWSAAARIRHSITQKQRFLRTGPTSGCFKKGSKLSKEHIDKVRAKLIGRIVSQETRAKISQSLLGHPGANRGGHISKEHKKLLSIAASKRIKEGRHNGCRGASGKFYSRKNNCFFHYRSNLELAWFRLLEIQDQVLSYNVEPITIPYKWRGSVHRYTPDILIHYISGASDLVEIKPEFAHDFLQNKMKWIAARNWVKSNQDVIQTFRIVGYDQLRSQA